MWFLIERESGANKNDVNRFAYITIYGNRLMKEGDQLTTIEIGNIGETKHSCIEHQRKFSERKSGSGEFCGHKSSELTLLTTHDSVHRTLTNEREANRLCFECRLF